MKNIVKVNTITFQTNCTVLNYLTLYFLGHG